MEPPASAPIAIGHSPHATADAQPALPLPAVLAASWGLGMLLLELAGELSSGMEALPSRMAPMLRRVATQGASALAWRLVVCVEKDREIAAGVYEVSDGEH